MKRVFKWAGTVIGIVIVAAVIWAMVSGDGADSALVVTVQNGSLAGCPGRTLAQLADGFMASPRWEAVKTDDGNEYVNMRGGITLQGKPVDALVQFAVDKAAQTFALRAFELNGIPQNQLMQAELIAGMCESAARK